MFNCLKKIPLFYAQQEVDSIEAKKDPTKMTDVLLDPNHTHFILVDDGSEGQFGKEIEFRAHLEAELRKGKSLKYYESRRNTRKKVSARSTNSAASMANTNPNNNNTPNSMSATNQQTGHQSDDDNDSQDEDGIRNETVPMILIVVQGGPNTLITVEESLKQAVPVLILAVILVCYFILIIFQHFLKILYNLPQTFLY